MLALGSTPVLGGGGGGEVLIEGLFCNAELAKHSVQRPVPSTGCPSAYHGK